MNRKIVYITGVFLLLMWAGGRMNLSASSISNKSNDMNEQDSIIPAKELYDAFKKDAAAATEQYAGETVTVKGFAVKVGPDVYTYPSVELSEQKGGKARTLCVLPYLDYLKLRKVSKGDEVTMTGEVRGFYEEGDQVLLKLCVIKE